MKDKVEKKERKQLRIVTFLTILFSVSLVGICWSASAIRLNNLEQNRAKSFSEATEYCDAFFDAESVVLDATSERNLQECEENLVKLASEEEQGIVEEYRNKIREAINYRDLASVINSFIDNGIVKSTIQEDEIIVLTEKKNGFSMPYQIILAEKINFLQSEFEYMRNIKDQVKNLFTSVDRAEVRPNVTRTEYEDAKKNVEELKQDDLKQDLSGALDRVLPVIEEQERIVRERIEQLRRAREEEQRRIAESWTNLDISPFYINQYSSNILSGCEAASLLMALKYKGYIRGMDYHSFALNMPTSSDPNTGFYLSMTDLEPRNEAHWIAPAPLASYGMSSSGAYIANVSGWSLDQLDNEVKNGNPVVIYLTFAFNDPKEYSNGVPRNLHVLVLSGFNSYTGEQQFYDPWPINGMSPTLSKARTEALYAASGYRALVVR